MNEIVYNEDFYSGSYERKIAGSRKVLNLLLKILPQVHTAADFGCGVGAWLLPLQEQNIRIHGFDGPWLPLKYLYIPEKDFTVINLLDDLQNKNSSIWNLTTFDLIITLEVAEHIPPSLADDFIDLLTEHANFILFSAAIPGQGGTEHLNEQYPSYWCNKFMERGFDCIDAIRPEIWNDEEIQFFYRQNIFIACKKELTHLLKCNTDLFPLDLVHPQQFKLEQERGELTIKRSVIFIFKKLCHRIKNLFTIGARSCF